MSRFFIFKNFLLNYKNVGSKKYFSLQCFLNLIVFFLSFILILVFLKFIFFDGGSNGESHLKEIKLELVKIYAINRSLNNDIVKAEFDLDRFAFDNIAQYLKEINRRKLLLKKFVDFDLSAGAKHELNRYLKILDNKSSAVARYKKIMDGYRSSKDLFYLNRNTINQQINDESLDNAHKLKLILDSIQRQVNLFLQYPEVSKKNNNIRFIKNAGNKLRRLSPDLDISIGSFLREGVALIENKVNRRVLVKKLLFDDGYYLDASALELSLSGESKRSGDIFILIGLVVLFFINGILFFSPRKNVAKAHFESDDGSGEDYDIEFMEGFKELMGKGKKK